jgi:23S rRNA (cytidine1920-2'-O)/16S rRNA (cytidine1409-2'-O)-methyltransferase
LPVVNRPAGHFVSRAGEKLSAALDAFELDVRGAVCADLGCNVGGFTDCLVQRGASRVYAVDTGYGELAWKLRNDGRVVVMERTNALHCRPPQQVDLVSIDVAWTPQERIVPAAVRWLKPGGRIVSLLKPHYELTKMQKRSPHQPLSDALAGEVCLAVCRRLSELGCCVRAAMRSAIRGKGGNVEFLLLVTPAPVGAFISGGDGVK